jgi:hypothetical protein
LRDAGYEIGHSDRIRVGIFFGHERHGFRIDRGIFSGDNQQRIAFAAAGLSQRFNGFLDMSHRIVRARQNIQLEYAIASEGSPRVRKMYCVELLDVVIHIMLRCKSLILFEEHRKDEGQII